MQQKQQKEEHEQEMKLAAEVVRAKEEDLQVDFSPTGRDVDALFVGVRSPPLPFLSSSLPHPLTLNTHGRRL